MYRDIVRNSYELHTRNLLLKNYFSRLCWCCPILQHLRNVCFGVGRDAVMRDGSGRVAASVCFRRLWTTLSIWRAQTLAGCSSHTHKCYGVGSAFTCIFCSFVELTWIYINLHRFLGFTSISYFYTDFLNLHRFLEFTLIS